MRLIGMAYHRIKQPKRTKIKLPLQQNLLENLHT